MNARRLEVAGTALVAAVVLLAFAPGPADAAIQVGETFTPSGGAAACGGDRTWLQYPVPSDGVITAWRFQADGTPPGLKLKLGRPTATPNEYAIIGESDLKAPVPTELNTYPISLPVNAGDLIGFYTATMGDCLRGGTFPTTEFDRLGEATLNSTSTFSPSTSLQLDVSVLLEPTPETLNQPASERQDEEEEGQIRLQLIRTRLHLRVQPGRQDLRALHIPSRLQGQARQA